MPVWLAWPMGLFALFLAGYMAMVHRYYPGMRRAAGLLAFGCASLLVASTFPVPWQIELSLLILSPAAVLASARATRVATRRGPQFPTPPAEPRREPVPPPPRDGRIPPWTTYN